jgi:hypothetical protein
MSELSWAETMRRVHQRAENRCEYCQTAQRVMGQAMHVEHMYPDGPDALENLCLPCPSCNLSKAQAGFAQKVTVCQVFLCRRGFCTNSVAVLDMRVYHLLWFSFY